MLTHTTNATEAEDVFIAKQDAIYKSNKNKKLYSRYQRNQAKQLLDYFQTFLFHKDIYLTYRQKFYTIRVYKPEYTPEQITTQLGFINQLIEAYSGSRVITNQTIIYRIPRI
jgi:hypothetical protein